MVLLILQVKGTTFVRHVSNMTLCHSFPFYLLVHLFDAVQSEFNISSLAVFMCITKDSNAACISLELHFYLPTPSK